MVCGIITNAKTHAYSTYTVAAVGMWLIETVAMFIM